MSQEFRKTILVVCEGQRSEPDYFHNLRNEVITKTNNIFIKILPIPKDEQQNIVNEIHSFKLRKGGKKRYLKNAINNIEPDDYVIEIEYKSQPTCYVRKAQLAYFEHGYAELWAVYDKDEHPKHDEAYSLSKNLEICDKIVNIGFSSISFEEWILMHFEYCNIAFSKSQCRDSDKNIFYCGSHINESDCKGEKCVIGRIVEKNFLSLNSSKSFEYSKYSINVNNALLNALKSRDLATDKYFFYNNNPYVSIDRLVFKLKNIEKVDLIWEYEKKFLTESNIFIKITNCNNVTNIEVENNTNRTYIIEENFLKLIDIQFNVLWKNDRICLNPNDSYLIYTKENLSMNDFQYALFKINEGEFKILDIIQIKNFV
jgi:hypothetical protein